MNTLEQRHSGLGIASFILSILSGVFIFVLIVIAGVIETSTPGGIDEESTAAVIIGLLIIALIIAALVALGLGIAGLFMQDRKKIFSILGTIFSAVTLLGTFLILMLGLAAE